MIHQRHFRAAQPTPLQIVPAAVGGSGSAPPCRPVDDHSPRTEPDQSRSESPSLSLAIHGAKLCQLKPQVVRDLIDDDPLGPGKPPPLDIQGFNDILVAEFSDEGVRGSVVSR